MSYDVHPRADTISEFCYTVILAKIIHNNDIITIAKIIQSEKRFFVVNELHSKYDRMGAEILIIMALIAKFAKQLTISYSMCSINDL